MVYLSASYESLAKNGFVLLRDFAVQMLFKVCPDTPTPLPRRAWGQFQAAERTSRPPPKTPGWRLGVKGENLIVRVEKKQVRPQEGEKSLHRSASGKPKPVIFSGPGSPAHQSHKPKVKGMGVLDSQFSIFEFGRHLPRNCRKTGPKMIRKVTGMMKKTRGRIIFTGSS